MRKIYSFMVAAVATFAAISCTQELDNNVPEQTGETVVYTASIDVDTKAALNEETRKSEWVPGDAITVLDGTKGWNFTTKGSGENAEFSNSEGFGEYRPVLAVYPADNYSANVAEKTVTAVIPTDQQAQKGTYHNTAALAIAYSESDSFAFKNAHTLLKFIVNADNVTHVIFHGNLEEKITGTVSVALTEDGTSVTCDDKTYVKCYAWHDKENKYFEKGQTYYMAIAPQTFTEGVTVKIQVNEGDEITVKTTAKPVNNAKVNTILDLGEIKYEAPVVHEWAVAGTFNGWNTTANPMTKEGDYYVVKNVTGLNFTQDADKKEGVSSTGIKFVVNGDTWKGGKGEAVAGTWDYVWGDGNNIYVDGATAETAYDIYVNPTEGDNGKFVIVAAGEAMPEDKQPEPEVTPGEASEWALVGAFSSWANKTMLTTEDANVVVLENVEMKAAEGFLVRKPSTDWADKYGAGDINYLKANHYITTSKGGNDMCLEADGTYDIYFNISTKDIYVMNAGTDYTTAKEQTASGKEPVQEEPEVTEKVVYLKPNSNWTKDNARFAAYFFVAGVPGEKWVSMTAVGDGTYEAHLPEGYDYGCDIIFCRMNPSTTANNWNNKWNQTSDLKTPTDGKNLYTVKAGTWDKGGGTWSVK